MQFDLRQLQRLLVPQRGTIVVVAVVMVVSLLLLALTRLFSA